jgi:hypothetical protein
MTPAGRRLPIEPRPDEVVRHAEVLAAAYNDPRWLAADGHGNHPHARRAHGGRTA